jgi:hypothetical protein
MNLAEFTRSLAGPQPPPGISAAAQALWWAGKGDWHRAHDIVMHEESDPDCAWVHAYLHRVEGDVPNARYWYRQAGKPAASGELDAEWTAIVAALLRPQSTR